LSHTFPSTANTKQGIINLNEPFGRQFIHPSFSFSVSLAQKQPGRLRLSGFTLFKTATQDSGVSGEELPLSQLGAKPLRATFEPENWNNSGFILLVHELQELCCRRAE